MKSIQEYLQSGHIKATAELKDIIHDTKPTDSLDVYMCIRIPNAKSDVLYYIKYADLQGIKPIELIDYSYILYDKAETKYGTSTLPDPVICFQFYSDSYDDFVTGYFAFASDNTHEAKCNIDPKFDKENDYKQIQHYFEQ